MKSPLLFLLLALPASSQTFVYDGHANCDKGYPGTTALVPANTLLIAVDDAAKANYPRLDGAKVTARINELLGAYGFPIKAQEFKYSTYQSMSPEALDHALNFRRNSFLM